MKAKLMATFAFAFCLLPAVADEGMWELNSLKDKKTIQIMQELGLQIPASEIYHPENPCIANAVVNFGDFCSGVVVSADGLVFTNHHCGLESIQQHSSIEHDYLKDGFVAHSLEEELPNPELFVRFLVRTEDVTEQVLNAAKFAQTENERKAAVDSVMNAIEMEVAQKDSTLFGKVDAFYAGNEFRLSVYRDFTDVRLVFAPPSSIGKFGWDTDNWMWPRHTGDFSVFRIYADSRNEPADYSPDNVPYHPDYVVPISPKGYEEGSFCMTLGYPGSTERYLSSYGIEEMMNNMNQAMIDIRGVKQAIWKRKMDSNPDIRIKYAYKYDESSNYWKYSIGVNKAIRQQKIVEKKREAELSLHEWIQQHAEEGENLRQLLSSLELGYGNSQETSHALAYFCEAFFYAPELPLLAMGILNLDIEEDEKQVGSYVNELMKIYANIDLDTDKETFVAVIDEYRSKVDEKFLPAMYAQIDTLYQGNVQAYVDMLYATSRIVSPDVLISYMERDTTYNLFDDPAITLCLDLITKYYEMTESIAEDTERIEEGERLFNAAMRQMYADHHFYPDANSTMRLSFGTVGGYTPFDGAMYNHYTTVKGIFEKVNKHADDPDFAVQPEILSLLSSGDFGKYANDKGEMSVCFLTNNDITGGNSGSAMFNARGELIGLAFDGNWEAMSSDIAFDPDRQRCIGVDIRYILFVMEKVGKADHLLRELKIKD